MLSERRSRALRDLAAVAGKAKSAEEACQAAVQVLNGYTLDLPFGLLYEFREAEEEARLAGCFGLAPDTAASPRFLRTTAGADRGWPVLAALRAGSPLLVEAIGERLGPLTCGPYPEPLQKAFVLPIPGLGSNPWAGVLIAGVSTRLPVDDEYRGFYDLLTGQVASALASARSYEEERRKADALAELDRAKTNFFSNVSHELRTPLTLILAPLEDLLARGGGEHDELARMHRNASRLLKLVNTLLDFSRIEAGRVQAVYEPTDISQLTADLASEFRSATERVGIELVVDCPPLAEPVFVDREMWEKIVLNLVSNAFKFTFQGRIEVRLHLAGTDAVLEVRDTGTGIAAQELPRIFERFHRVEGVRARSHEGTGIGLALVQELARLHGGTISVESQASAGSQFTVRIPRGSSHLPASRIQAERTLASSAIAAQTFVDEALQWLPDAEESALPDPEPTLPQLDGDMGESPGTGGAPARAGTILLADDNSDMRGYLRRILKQRYEVHAVPDGAAALELARSQPVDLVLTDVMMPRMDGFQLLRCLRGDARTRSIPIILLSARAGEESRVEGLDAGADDYLIKPFTVRELLARVDAHLRMARMRRESAALLESERRFRSMADCAPVMMWTSGVNRNCDYFNKGWLDFRGRTLEEEVAGCWTAGVHPDEAARVLARWEEAAVGRTSSELEFRLRRHDGQYRWVAGSVAARQSRDGEFLGYVLSCVDIDDRKRVQQEIRLLNSQLEERVRQRTAQIEAANKELEAFSYSVSHDLRAPLRHVGAFLELLEDHIGGGLDEKGHHYFDTVKDSARQMGKLIDDLLRFSRTGRIEMRHARIGTAELVGQVQRELAPSIEDRKVVWTVKPLPEVTADAALLKQVFVNLFDNAIKYTGTREEAAIEIGCREEGQEWIFYVQDNGVGFDMRYAHKLFSVFQRLHGKGEFEGTGIGLANVRRIVGRHGGRTWAEGAVDQGATFYFSLPRGAGEEADGQASEPSAAFADREGRVT
jgi:PAS domain S-box-containing protein